MARFVEREANKEFDCYDCRKWVEVGRTFSFDNKRQVRICMSCLEKLKMIVNSEEASAAAAGKRDRWHRGLMPVRPWQMSPPDWDINAWPQDIQEEYHVLEREERGRRGQ